jgi:hypothetical protein
MRCISQGILAAALLGSLCIAPAWGGAASKPLGSVIQTVGGSIDSVNASVGASVFSGDAIGTQSVAGRLRLRLGVAQVFLLADSTATLEDIPGGVAANLTYGTAGFSTSGSEPVEIRTVNGIVRSKGPEESYGQVMIAGPHELIVTSFRGALDVDVDGEVRTVNDGQSYRVVVDDDPAEQTTTDDSGGSKRMKQNAGDIRVRRRRPVVFYLIIFGAAALLGYFYYHHLNESPSAP